MKLTWTPRAKRDLLAIADYYSLISEDIARNVLDRIVERCIDLIDFPFQGPIHPDVPYDDIRYIIVDYYRITYQILEEEVQIQTVFDWRQNPASERGSE
ncbi:type II toxin-antitoxin system RelE/ParE family toxin [bacterium]|nr:type II toxin-antitoxin system RelE/ParE family toxin [bacterium]